MDNISNTFTSFIENKFSAQKILVILIIFFIQMNIDNNNYKSFAEWVANQNLSLFKNFYENISHIKIDFILITIFSIFFLESLYLHITKIIINGQLKQNKYLEGISQEYSKIEKTITIDYRIKLKELYKEEAKQMKEKIKSLTENGATLFSFSIFCFYFFNKLGAIDLIILITILFTSIYYIYKITFFFLEQNSKILFIQSITSINDVYNTFSKSSDNLNGD